MPPKRGISRLGKNSVVSGATTDATAATKGKKSQAGAKKATRSSKDNLEPEEEEIIENEAPKEETEQPIEVDQEDTKTRNEPVQLTAKSNKSKNKGSTTTAPAEKNTDEGKETKQSVLPKQKKRKQDTEEELEKEPATVIPNNGQSTTAKKEIVPVAEQPNQIEKSQEQRQAEDLPSKKRQKINDGIAPNVTLYINNLNDQISAVKLQENLFLLFSTYGDIIDISIRPKDPKMRGQAHLTYANINSAKLALRSLQGDKFFGKELNIAFSKNQTKKIALI